MKFRFLIFSTLLIVLVTPTSLALIQISQNIPSFGTISAQSPSAYFGVNVQYYSEAERNTYFPDLWTLVKYTGATHLIGSPWKLYADEAAKRGTKIMFTYGRCFSPDDPMYETVYSSKEKMKAHLDKYNIPQFKNHPGVWAHNICIEPFNKWDAQTDTLVEVLRYGIQYIRSLDPTHPVTISLNPAGAFTETGDYIEKRKQWINRFIDVVDFLCYNYYEYLWADAGVTWGRVGGPEFWRDTATFRNFIIKQFDEVLIPASKGKPIVIGETGCPTGTITTQWGNLASFTEEQQAEYFRIYGEETRKRGIFVCVYKLIDTVYDDKRFGLFKPENDGSMNIPKVAASLVRNYLSISSKST